MPERCDIYTDVDGVCTTDPRIVPKAKRLEKVSFEEMLEMASLGAEVLQVRSVELAMVHGVRILVRSSFDPPDAAAGGELLGTLICGEEEIVEKKTVTGIAYSKDEAQITLRRVEDKPGVAANALGAAGRCRHQRRYDRSKCLGGRLDHRPHLHGAGRRI